jgi:hypothetical protein
MHGIGVGGGMDRHRLDAHFMRGPQDAQSDFAPVGDQDRLMAMVGLADHHQRLVEFDRLAVVDQDGLDRAGGRAVMGFITFMASTISSVSPALTTLPTLTKSGAPGSAAR